MQSAGRAVTSSRQPSLYTSSRHALSRPARYAAEGALRNANANTKANLPSPTCDHTWNAASSIVFAAPSVRCDFTWRNAPTIIFSQPAAQKRCSSSKSRPPAPPIRPKPIDPKSKPSKPMVYKGREPPNKFDYALSFNPYQRGRPASPPGTLSPPGTPNAILDPQIRRPLIVARPPPPAPLIQEDPKPATAAPRAPTSPATLATPAPVEIPVPAETPAPAETAATTAPSIPPAPTPPVSPPQSPVYETPGQELAYAVDDVTVPEGITAAETSTAPSSNRSQNEPLHTTETRALAMDEMLRLKLKNTQLESALAEQKEGFRNLQKTHDHLVKSSAQTIQNIKTGSREALEARAEKHNRIISSLHSTRDKQAALLSERLVEIHDLRKQLEVERDTIGRQVKRRAVERQHEATMVSRERQEKEKSVRKLIRRNYESFREFSYKPVQYTKALLTEPDLLASRANWYNREIAYWGRALRDARSFEGTSKGGDEMQLWEAGKEVQTKTQNLQEQEALRQKVIRRLEQRLQHRDSIFSQVKAYLQSSSQKADTARLQYVAELKELRGRYESILSLQHDHRRILRDTRFGVDPHKESPERTAYQRASTADVLTLDRPIASMVKEVNSRLDFWKGKIKVLKAEPNRTRATELKINFYRNQVRALGICATLLRVVRMFSTLQMEAGEATWISEQPTYQQSYWQDSIRVSRRQTSLMTNIKSVVKHLRGDGMKRHKIMSTEHVLNTVHHTKTHERAAFAHAFVKKERNAFTKNEEAEIGEVLDMYCIDNAQETKRRTRQLEPFMRICNEVVADQMSETLGKRLLVPARTRRRDTLRKAALAKTKHVEEEFTEEEDSPVEPEAAVVSTTTDTSGSAASAEMTSKDTSPESTAAPEKVEATQPKPTTNTEKQETSVQQPETEVSPQPETETPPLETEAKSGVPTFKVREVPSPIPRLAPKATTIYSRARSRLGFKPPRPMFKETRRRSQEAGMSSTDLLDREELSQATTLSPLLYQIPAQNLRNALMASKTSQAAFWRYTLYKSPCGEKPLLHYCTKFEQAEQVAKHFSQEKIIGFDIEWEMGSSVAKGGIKDNVSLIQIACENRIALFQIALFAGETKEDLMPPSLKTILESRDILKAGVNIAGDFTRLRKCLGIEGQGIFELSHLYKLVKFSEKEPAKVNKSPLKLAEQVQEVLFLPLHKGNVRTSAWSRRLSMEQVEYAATDAYAGFRLFRELDRARSAMVPTPPRPALWEADQPIILGNGERAGENRSKRKTGIKKATEVESQTTVLSPEEEQALDDEEEEAQAEAGADDTEYFSAEEEPENFEPGQVETIKYEAADQWLGQWESNLSRERKGKNTPTNIRAYALWHVQGLPLQQVAEAMRQPPLALTTVSSYVLEVVKSESLPYDSPRLQEALDVIPPVAHWRYKSLIQKTRSEI